MKKAMVLTLVACAIGLGSLARSAEDAEPLLTVEWVFSDAGKNATRMPRYAWRGEGDLLLLDETRPEAERVLERFRAANNTRRPAFDRAVARASLGKLTGQNVLPETLGWPEDIDQAGAQALYVIAEDLFVLDLGRSSFQRLTRTPAAESYGRFSPDGRQVAFVRDNDLYLVELATGGEKRLTHDGSATVRNGALSWVYGEEIFDHDVAGYWWSPDSGAIAFLRSDEANVSEVPFPGFEPAVPEVVWQRYPKAGGANPEVTLGLVEVAGGPAAFVDRRVMPFEYVLGVVWSPDGKKVAVQVTNRMQTRADLYFVERNGGGATLVLSDPDVAWVDIHALSFLSDGRFIWTSERDGHSHLYLYDASGKLLKQLTKGEWSVRGPKPFYSEALDSFWIDEARGVVYFTATERATTARDLYRVRLEGSGLERLTTEDGVHGVEMDAKRRYWVDSHSTHCQTPTLVVHDTRSARVWELASSRAGLLEALDWQCSELLTVPADDGTALNVRLLRPKPFDPGKRYPAIVYVYGGPSSPLVRDAFSSSGRTAEFEQILSHRGYVVMSVDPRSATAASKTAQNVVEGKVWSDVELADMLAGVRWLKGQGFVDGDRVGVWGWSGGGMSTLLLMTRSTEFKAGIAVAPVSDWRYYDTKFTEAFMKTPADNPEGYAHTSLVARAGDLHGRLMLVHGTHDDNVHPQNTWAMIDALIKAGKPFDVMVYPLRKHSIKDDPARIDLFNRMLEFWDRNL